MAVGQLAQYGGRLDDRDGWERLRIVDRGSARQPFGFSGMALVSARTGAQARYRLWPKDRHVSLYYQAVEDGPELEVYAGDQFLTTFSTNGLPTASRVEQVDLPPRPEGQRRPRALRLQATGPGAKVFGLSFESESPGVLYDAIGPVGADARVYLSLEPESFHAQLRALRPDLVILMIGGNDSLAVRRGRRRLRDVRRHHRELINRVRESLPEADIMVWAPMDSGRREGDEIVSKAFIRQVRDIQKEVTADAGCAFWDTFEAMGGEGSFGRWFDANIMNKDLIHPRARGGELLGHLFAMALMNAYLDAEPDTRLSSKGLNQGL